MDACLARGARRFFVFFISGAPEVLIAAAVTHLDTLVTKPAGLIAPPLCDVLRI
jgi:hypothetical protein